MLTKRCRVPLILIAILGLMPCGAWAYGTDVHFNLTYVLCHLAGMPAKDAIWVADADQSMDDNDCTTAFGESVSETLEDVHWVTNGTNWHAFSSIDDIPAAHMAIQKRMDDLHDRAFALMPPPDSSDRSKTLLALIAMGQFLHFEQDFFAHRHLSTPRQDTDNALDPDTWRPYGPVKGHALDGHTPDYVGARPRLAALMIKDK